MGIIQRQITGLYGRKAFQAFFERLFFIALRGMNYGNGSDYEKSGEKYIFELINKVFTHKEILIFDIGANVGGYSKALIQNIKMPFRIYAFEPTSFCINELKKINHPNFIYHQLGFSSNPGTAEIHYDYEGSVWASIENNGYERIKKELSRTEVIQLETIDRFMEEYSIAHIDFLKIDIEGHELKAFQGAENALENGRISMIQFEFGLASLYAVNRLADFFLILKNYDIYRILQDGLQKITYHESFEIYLTTNYLAVNKNANLKVY
ncbi:FkbM family methyltransferase [uncultured Chryseobacterium sp.]|uniref:FkbM family methyltransferase n=1 Tax=uncultured Chryseobacterium sp. TaxID=259322 RepID=UPI0025E04D5A|nr:FkbM family methyltransferase [uncultured Chryseobacterium sp.]